MKHCTKEEILEILKKHKNVSVSYTKNDRDAALNNPSLYEFFEDFKRFSDNLKSTPTEQLTFSLFRRFEECGDRLAFEDLYFNRRQKLLAYALGYWLYEREEDLALLEDIIWVILDEYTWSLPAHLFRQGLSVVQKEDTYTVDLFAAETAHALAETVSLLGDVLHPIIKERIHREIESRIFARAYENHGEFFWHKVTNNWSAVCSGSVGMAAMYEISDDERLSFFIERALLTLQNFYKGFPKDGACLEGLSYWDYGFGYFMAFADMLYRRTEGEINLFDDEHIKNAGFFYTKVFFKGARTVSFSDGGSRGKCSPGALSMLSHYYPDFVIPGAEYISFDYSGTGCARFARTIRDVVYAAPTLKDNKNEIVGTYQLPDAGWFISSSQTGVGVAAKAGTNNEPHNHNDIGSFLVYKNGESIIADIGAGEYTRQYFDPKTRYSIFCNNSFSHSVPIINGEGQKAGAAFYAKDVKMSENGMVSDISTAYSVEGLKSLIRDFTFDKSTGTVTVRDAYEFDLVPKSVTERFVSPGEPEIFDGKVVITTNNQDMAIYYEAESWSVKYELVIDKNHRGNDRQTYVIDFALKNPAKSITAEFEIK